MDGRRHLSALAAGLALGALISSACGQTTVTPHDTSLFVRVRWTSAQYSIDQLQFQGFTERGTDAFPTTTLPRDAGMALTANQQVRVFLASDLVGKTVDVVVYGYSGGKAVITGSGTSPVIVANDEVELSIDLVDAVGGTGGGAGGGVGGGAGGGAGGGGGFDAGGVDAGGADAGYCTATCTKSCCAPTTSTCAPSYATGNPRYIALAPGAPDGGYFIAPVADCGPSGRLCGGVCDPLRANTCIDGACTCYPMSNACPAGTRCVTTFEGNTPKAECRCDLASKCEGCCNGNNCERLGSQSFCGNSGTSVGTTACTNCSGCDNSGVCAGAGVTCTITNGCRSGRACLAATWPLCASGAFGTSACVACDTIRSSACGVAGGCSCGTTGGPCGEQQYCDRTGAIARCRPLR